MENKDEQTESKKVALYIRVSTEEQVERYGPDLQKESLVSLIKSKGRLDNGKDKWVLAGENYVYMEDGISGTMDLDERPAFSKLKEDVLLAPEGNKPFDVVAVYKIDRFARKLKILLNVIDFFEEHKIEFISANESIDTSTPFGKAMLNIIGVIAELERETITQRTQDGRMQAIKKGVVMGSYATFGFQKGLDKLLKISKKESATVRYIFDLCVNKKAGPYQISQILMDEKYLSPEASAIVNKKKKGAMKKKTSSYFWRSEVIRKILQDEIYIGNIYYNKAKRGVRRPREEWTLADVKAPVIIDRLTFNKAQKVLQSIKHERKQGKSGHTYLLSGLLRCDSCYEGEDKGRIYWIGERKKVKKSGNFSYYYKCGRKNKSKHDKICTTLPLPGKETEDYIINFCRKIIEDPIATYNHQSKLKSSKSALSHLKRKQSQIIGLINSFPGKKLRTREMREAGHISLEEVNKSFAEFAESDKKLRIELNDIGRQISENIISKGYENTLKLFSEKYSQGIEGIFKDRNETYTLLHELIEEVIVYSRPVKTSEKIAGIQKKDRQIPFRLHIKLKLPQDILRNLINRFGVEISHLSG